MKIFLIITIISLATTVLACDPISYYGCSPETLNRIAAQQFQQRQNTNNNFRQLRYSQEVRKYNAEVARQKRLAIQAEQRQQRIAQKNFEKAAKRADKRGEVLVQNSDGTWSNVQSYTDYRHGSGKRN